MRLFTAVYPAPEIIEEIRERIPAGTKHSSPDRWHITLSFHADVSPNKVEALEERLSTAMEDQRPFTLQLAGSGRFGPVSWLGLAGDLDALGRLARSARRAATGAHISADRKPYSPHLTIGRDEGVLAEALTGFTSQPWQVTEVRLIDSHLGSRVTHNVLGVWSLVD